MLTAAVPVQAEWNGNDIMFIQERRSQTQISVSKMLGCKERTHARDHQFSGVPLLLLICFLPRISHTSMRHSHSTLLHIPNPSHLHTNMSHMPHTYTLHINTHSTYHTLNTQGPPYTPQLSHTNTHQHKSHTSCLHTSHTPHAYTPSDLHIYCMPPPHEAVPSQIHSMSPYITQYIPHKHTNIYFT